MDWSYPFKRPIKRPLIGMSYIHNRGLDQRWHISSSPATATKLADRNDEEQLRVPSLDLHSTSVYDSSTSNGITINSAGTDLNRMLVISETEIAISQLFYPSARTFAMLDFGPLDSVCPNSIPFVSSSKVNAQVCREFRKGSLLCFNFSFASLSTVGERDVEIGAQLAV